MSLNFLTKSMWEGKKWIIPGYLISWNTIIPVNFVCVCVGIVSPMYYFLWSTYILPISYIRMLPRFSAREIGWENVLQQCMCNIIYACVTSHVQNHVVKVFEPYMCSTCDCESIYFTWAISHLLFMLDKSNPKTFQMVVCCISFFFNSTFICFFFLFMKVYLLLFYCTTCYRVIWCSHRCSIEHQINIWTILMHTEFLVDII